MSTALENTQSELIWPSPVFRGVTIFGLILYWPFIALFPYSNDANDYVSLFAIIASTFLMLYLLKLMGNVIVNNKKGISYWIITILGVLISVSFILAGIGWILKFLAYLFTLITG